MTNLPSLRAGCVGLVVYSAQLTSGSLLVAVSLSERSRCLVTLTQLLVLASSTFEEFLITYVVFFDEQSLKWFSCVLPGQLLFHSCEE